MSRTTASTLAVAPALNRKRRGSTWPRSGHAAKPVLGMWFSRVGQHESRASPGYSTHIRISSAQPSGAGAYGFPGSALDDMARFEGLAGEPEYVSGGPRERFSSPRWSVFRVVALGLLAVAVGAYGGYRWGFAHGRHATVRVDASEVVLPVGGFPSAE